MSVKKHTSPTWVLFKSGNFSMITVSLYAALSGSTRPIDAYIITECEGEFSKAARRAADCVYYIFKKKFVIKPLVAGFDLQNINEKIVSGSSGGLAFAIALAKEMYTGDDPGPVAATGEILSNGELAPVDGISEKITTAISLLPDSSWIFLPTANKSDIPEELLSEISNKNIKLIAVSSVVEALDSLFQWPEISRDRTVGRSTAKLKKYSKALVFSFIVVGAAIFLQVSGIISNNHNPEISTTKHSSLQTLAPDKIDKINKPERHQNSPESQQSSDHPVVIENRSKSSARIHNLPTNSVISINLTGRTILEKKFAILLSTTLRDYFRVNGQKDQQMTIKGSIKIEKGVAQMPAVISLRNLFIDSPNRDVNFTDFPVLEDIVNENYLLSRSTAIRLVDKITEVAHLKQQ